MTFDRSLDGCVAMASQYNENKLASPSPAHHFAFTRADEPDTLWVAVWSSSSNSVSSAPFSIVAFC